MIFKSPKKIVFGLCLIFLMIAALETGLRVANWSLKWFQLKDIVDERSHLQPYKDKEWTKVYFDELVEALDPPEMRSSEEFHGKYVNMDAHGYRKTWNPERSGQKTPKTIYVFGGSTIWGDGARDNYTIPSYLSKKLLSEGYNFVVHNYGKTSFATRHELDLLMRLLKDGHKPDYVVFYDGFNDVLNAYQMESFNVNSSPPVVKTSQWASFKNLVQENSMVYTVITSALASFDSEGIMATYPSSRYSDEQLGAFAKLFVEYYGNFVESLDHLSHEFGFQYLLFWQPVIFTETGLVAEEKEIIDQSFNNKAFGKFYRAVHAVLQKNPPRHFFNLSDILQERKEMVYTDWCHLSEEGNEIVARRIVKIFRKEFLK